MKTVGNAIADFGSRIKSRQKSLAGATNQPDGVGNASLTGSFMQLISDGGFISCKDSDEISSQGNHELETKKAPLTGALIACVRNKE